jgi:hypothetical protein
MAAALQNFSWMDAGLFRVFASEAFYRRKSDVRGHPTVSALDSVFLSEKIGGLSFVLSNSENISGVTFLKCKNSRKQEQALWHLVNRLVPEQNIKQSLL